VPKNCILLKQNWWSKSSY